jgi:hypothetical protein
MEVVKANTDAITRTLPKILTVDRMQKYADSVMMRGLKQMQVIIMNGEDRDKINAYRNVISFGKYVQSRKKAEIEADEALDTKTGVIMDESMRITCQ